MIMVYLSIYLIVHSPFYLNTSHWFKETLFYIFELPLAFLWHFGDIIKQNKCPFLEYITVIPPRLILSLRLWMDRSFGVDALDKV